MPSNGTEFSIASINKGCLTLNTGGKTVAIISDKGYIDWLLRYSGQSGDLITRIPKRPHMSNIYGLAMRLGMPHLTDPNITKIDHEILEGGQAARIIGYAASKDGNFESTTEAKISLKPDAAEYQWDFTTTLRSLASKPIDYNTIEYNNIYPGKCGRCMLFTPEKEYHTTLMVDKQGTVWEFPHQHTFRYAKKLEQLAFAEDSIAGFFGEQDGSPVCQVKKSPMPPTWGICDMYYDLHCQARPQNSIQPGESLTWEYEVKYLSAEESKPYIQQATPIQITEEDWAETMVPRLALGMNHFDSPVMIDQADDASGFKQKPPKLVWDRTVGHQSKGALRLFNEEPEMTVWSATPPSQIPAGSEFTLAGLTKTEGVMGNGFYLRVRYHTFEWEPTPHVEWVKTLCSPPVTGTTEEWITIEVPRLRVPDEHKDYLVYIDTVLDGQGAAWLTDVDVELSRKSTQVTASVP